MEDLLGFTHELYKAQDEWQERLSEKNKFFLTAFSLLGGASMAFASRDYVKKIGDSPAILLYYLFLLLAWIFLIAVLVLIVRAEWPTTHAKLEPSVEFLSWRDKYAQELQQLGYSQEEAFRIANQQLERELTKKLADAESINRQINLRRQELSDQTLTSLITATLCIMLQIGLERMIALEKVVTW